MIVSPTQYLEYEAHLLSEFAIFNYSKKSLNTCECSQTSSNDTAMKIPSEGKWVLSLPMSLFKMYRSCQINCCYLKVIWSSIHVFRDERVPIVDAFWKASSCWNSPTFPTCIWIFKFFFLMIEIPTTLIFWWRVSEPNVLLMAQRSFNEVKDMLKIRFQIDWVLARNLSHSIPTELHLRTLYMCFLGDMLSYITTAFG